MPAAAPPEAPEHVSSTLNRDGSRRWLHPRVSPGPFPTWRRVVAYALIVLYNALPWIPIGGKPSILLDLPRREFTFFGTTFLPTDTLPFMLFLAGVFVTIFLVTALFGRLWCGWGCPQTVYMEFVYRPIERFFDGSPESRRRGKGGASGVRKVLKYVAFFLVSLHLAHTFLAYFVGAENLFEWTRRSPVEHPTAFIIVAATTGLMMFDFCWFREQTCVFACPYGRFQSVMLDRSSLIIAYDDARGEPRGRMRRPRAGAAGDAAASTTGDCVDCSLCVVTCPTGIDIRDGLQMECIGCAQCIDACDAVMTKIGRPTGLIRYSSQEVMEAGRRRLLRPRVVLYPVLLAIIVGAFLAAVIGRAPADITILRVPGQRYTTLVSGEIANDMRIKIVNRTEGDLRLDVDVDGPDGARLSGVELPVAVGGGEVRTVVGSVAVPASAFEQGRASVMVTISGDDGFAVERRYRLQGPRGSSTPGPAAAEGSVP